MIKALIVDDERYAREELRELLNAFPEVQVVGEAANAQEAREQIAALEPDLVFLDIQMPEETGFDLVASLGSRMPTVIFTTAFDSFALQAFEFGVADYLLKPISPKRLGTCLDRLLTPSANEDNVPGCMEGRSPLSSSPFGADDKVLLGDDDRIWYVPVGSIVGAESLGKHSVVWLKDGAPVLRRSLAALEARLPAHLFFRANRSQLINLMHVQSVAAWFSGGLKLSITGGRSVEVSRRQAKIFREMSSL